ncbi:oligoendopeptidase F [Thermotomaculum hydrothermale]|uniref:Oligopeptidase F n=1 Tax=Thermotomaculum hydrothermale TaxID=981385 RepID=A0A7R6PPB5_9BACT|nr:oligoendopeptidase F [Thermotomaculum hydrothermale]BBB32811.1 oligoendopeptidase F [Thermotomaculum hydrothermale]
MKFFVILSFMLMFTFTAISKTREEIPEKYKWNLKDLYPSVEVFKKNREEFSKKIESLKSFQGKLGNSPEELKKCLDTYFNLHKELDRLITYVSLRADEDLGNSENQKLKNETYNVARKFAEASSFIEPEIISLGEKKINEYLENKDLKLYKLYLTRILKEKKHILSKNEEALLAKTSMISDAPYQTYSIFSYTDMPFPIVELNGEKVKLNQAAYTKWRSNPDIKIRNIVFPKFFGTYKSFENTFGTLLYSQVKKDWFYANARKYNSSLEAALTPNEVPVKVYHNLIKEINANLPLLHRYLKLRKKMLGLKELTYADLYTPLVKSVDAKYTYEQAQKIIEDALKPLGNEYETYLHRAFKERWIDVYPNEGKRGGAYSSGNAYDVHPYILLNYNEDYESLSTLAHELGHSMHSMFSNTYQPYVYSDYTIFVAEVASTFNENMLNHYLLIHTKDRDMKLFLLGHLLEGIRQTIFRQAMFAEFELEIHKRVEKGEALTGADLSKIYLNIVRKYYGHDKGICKVDDLYGIEWAYIPHFYYNFYVYQYATSLIASTHLAQKVIHGDKKDVEEYLGFIKSGCSDTPINILRKAGADLETEIPFETTMKVFSDTMDQIEKLLNEKN